MKTEQCVPKRRHINSRRRGITQKKAYNEFNFNAHIDHSLVKSITLINMLARTAKLQRGLGHKVLKAIYDGEVVLILTYGAPI
jgi:hypothetical protein